MTHKSQTASDLDLLVTPQEVARMLDAGDDFLLIDCRKPDEYEICRIKGSRLIPMHELSAHLDALHDECDDCDRHVVVYCHSGRRSLNVTLVLRELGFANVRSMTGGIDRWSREIDPSVPRY